MQRLQQCTACIQVRHSKVEAMGTGTRALNNMVKRSVSFAAFEHIGPHSAKPKKIIITKDCADHPEKYSTVDW